MITHTWRSPINANYVNDDDTPAPMQGIAHIHTLLLHACVLEPTQGILHIPAFLPAFLQPTFMCSSPACGHPYELLQRTCGAVHRPKVHACHPAHSPSMGQGGRVSACVCRRGAVTSVHGQPRTANRYSRPQGYRGCAEVLQDAVTAVAALKCRRYLPLELSLNATPVCECRADARCGVGLCGKQRAALWVAR